MPTQVEISPQQVLDNISQAIEEMLVETQSTLTAIGIGCPGPIDIERGLVLSPSNLPNWIDFPIVELLKKNFDVPILLDNDANAAALGEYFYGAGRGFKEILYVTISTGIGGAIISEGQIHHGVKAGAGEVGHTTVQADGIRCRCGNYGCLETIASGTGIARRMREKLAESNGKSSEYLDKITAETVVEALKNGDKTAQLIWEETIKFLAIGIGNAITLVAPEAVIIGGGVMSAGELLLEPLRRQLGNKVTKLPIAKVKILQASLGSESGVCGALVLAQTANKKNFNNVN